MPASRLLQNIKQEEEELREMQARHGVDGEQHAKPAKEKAERN